MLSIIQISLPCGQVHAPEVAPQDDVFGAERLERLFGKDVFGHARAGDGRDLAGSAFVLSDLSGAQFREANLARVRIHDTRLAGTGTW